MTNIYLSGRFSITAKKERAWLKRTGCKYRCFSFAVVDPKGLNYAPEVAKALAMCEKKKINIMMDSGAHSLHVLTRSTKKRGTKAKAKQQISVDQLQQQMFRRYVKYCHANKDNWAFYVTLDFKRSQPVIYEMQKHFEHFGLAPMPVVHGESNLEYWIKKHYDMGHRYIALGGASFHRGTLDYYFDTAFDLGEKLGIKYHGLAFTSLKMITYWPWESVDSSTWSRCAAFGQITLPDVRRMRFYNIHVSERHCPGLANSYNNMSRQNKARIDGMLKEHGFDIKAMRDGANGEAERHDFNGYVYSNLQRFGLDWDKAAMRKVTWESLI